MDRKLMDEVKAVYVAAADRMMRAGLDEVLVHCAHCSLICPVYERTGGTTVRMSTEEAWRTGCGILLKS